MRYQLKTFSVVIENRDWARIFKKKGGPMKKPKKGKKGC